MKDEKRYEWVDVTSTARLVGFLNDGDGIYGLRLSTEAGIVHFEFNGSDNYAVRETTRVVNTGQLFRIERRVEVEQPKEVVICTTDGNGHVLGSKTISYQSAKELGLI